MAGLPSRSVQWGKYAIAFCCGLIFANAAGAAFSKQYELAFLSFLAVALGAHVIRYSRALQ